MTEELQLTSRTGQPWSIAKYIETTVMPNVVSLLPRGEADWPAFEVALRAAVLGKEGLARAIAGNPESALVAIVKCARAGLSLNPIDEHFDLIPRKGVIYGEPRAKGWMFLAMASGAVEFIQHDVVYKQEHNPNVPFFDPVTRRPNHVPNEFERDQWDDEKDIIGAYCAVKLKGQPRMISRAMSRKELNKRRAMAQTDNVYKAWLREMFIAKVDKATFKSPEMPKTPQMAQALLVDIDEDEEVRPAPLAAAPTPIRSSPPKKTGGEVMWDARNEEPLPTDAQHCEELRKAIDVECVNQDISSDTLREISVKLLALHPDAQDLDAELKNLSGADLDKLLDHLIALREKKA